MAKGKIFNAAPDDERFYFFCPGCKYHHAPRIKGPGSWIFNWDFDKPTLSPSILVTTGPLAGINKTCHSFIKNGMIEFLDDCFHELKGTTVELPDIDD